jgi:hypothetical protein
MAWIELHQSVFTHRKTLAFADILNVPEVIVVGHLAALWTWGLDNAPDGVLPISERIIARAAQWTGVATAFVNALISVGFLDETDTETIHIHNWERYAGRLIEKRKANAARMREARSKYAASTEEERVEHVQRTNDARAGATVPNRTIPNQPSPPTPPKGEGVSVAEQNFQDFYREFMEHYPPDRDGKKPGGIKIERKARAILVRDRDDVLVATKHYAQTDKVIRGFVKAPDSFLTADYWRAYITPPEPQRNGTNGTHRQGAVEGARPAQTGEPNERDRERIKGLRSLVAGNASEPRAP